MYIREMNKAEKRLLVGMSGGKYEYQTTMGAGRFEVRNARVSVTGNVLPIVAYKAEIDLSDEGSIKMLDAYARLFPAKGLTVTAGQMRVPFTIDAHRSPHQQYFANRSFIAKQVGNVRDVGITLGYTLPTDLPITIVSADVVRLHPYFFRLDALYAQCQVQPFGEKKLGFGRIIHFFMPFFLFGQARTGRNTGAIVRHRRLL